ncbi:acetyl-CoA carboxylase biotin carboxyl carrier protein subunit [Moheibacter sp.]|uniref:acetyl-CoA carboxylase biotin carboxyl carrier protein subunit n=1 Tax=Moheibacter sp. TaxID=1965316 RepID=UPI003C727B2B
MNTYKIIVDGDKSFDFSSKDTDSLDSISLQENKFQVLKDDVSYQTEILSADFLNRNYTVLVNGNEYEVNIARPLDQLIKEMGFEVGAGKQVNAIKAPMPGLILSINVSVGQEVQENDSLLILEAMKMENNFASPRAGIIKSIMVEKGQAVDKGQLLIEFE